jgi:drug/metabolite transporter (DMT)-like permease
MRETWRIRAFMVGVGVAVLAASYLIFIPRVPLRDRGWVNAAMPIFFLFGLLISIGALLMERRNPSLFARLTPTALRLPMYGLLGVLMALSETALVLIAAAMAGATMPAATPLMRLRRPSESD